MSWQDLMLDGYGRIQDALEHALEGLPPGLLDKLPKPDCNSIGWLAWHLIRVHDGQVADLMGEEQLWIKDGWHARFNRPKDPEDSGYGHGPKEVAAFRSPEIKVIVDYSRATVERTKVYMKTLTPAKLNRKLDEPYWTPVPTVGVRLVSILADCLEHAGQAAYARGLLQGKGWQKY
jgi:hypothetical protein